MKKMAVFVRDKTFYKTLLRLAAPISLQNLVTFAVSFADNLMVGTLGDNAISGVYMGSQIQTLLQLFTSGVGSAMLILSAQYWGRQDTDSIKTIVASCCRFGVWVSAVLTVICAAFPQQVISLFTPDPAVIAEGAPYLQVVSCSYLFFCISQLLIFALRSVESARVGMYVSFITLFVNVSLNWVLIFGHLGFPKLGILGAAVATLVSRILEAAAIILYLFFVDKRLSMRLADFLRKDRELMRDFIRYGTPVIIGELVWAVNMTANSMIIGRYQAEVIAASSMTNMLNNMAYIWISGLSAAVGIMTGKTVGAGDMEQVKLNAKTIQVIFLGVGAVTGIIVFLLRDPFISLYSVTTEAAGYARQFMTVLSVTIIGTCYQATCLGGLVKAGGDTSFVFKNDSVFVFCVVIPSAIIASVNGAPPWVVFACLKCDQILKCFVAVVKINRFNWMKQLTRNG